MLVIFDFSEQAKDVFSTESSVAAGTDAVGFQYSLVTPSSHCIDMHIEQVSYLTCC